MNKSKNAPYMIESAIIDLER